MSLREDSDSYCLLWVGAVILATYYFNFLIYMSAPSTYSSFITLSLPLLGIPLLLVFTFIGYFRPEKGKTKPNMLALSVVFSLFFLLSCFFAYDLFNSWDGGLFIESIGFAAWGIGSAMLTAGGFSIIQPLDKSIATDLYDLKSLPFYPHEEEPEELPEETEETIDEVDETETTSSEDSASSSISEVENEEPAAEE